MARGRATAVGAAPSVLIISAAMGAGHDGVAFELERRLLARGATVEVVDYLQLLPARMGPFYRAMYARQLRYAPASYEWLYGRIDRGLVAPVARWLGQLGKRPVRRLVRDGGHDLVVSTYPLGCQAIGVLRRRGRLGVPAVGFLTDVDVHGLWLHPGVDRNLTVWEGSATEAQARVGTPSHAVGPVLPEVFRSPVTPAERAEGRARLGLDGDEKVVLVVAGSWGVGDIGATARAIVASGVGVPVVLCGRNDTLLAELDRVDGVIALGWTRDVRALLAASDAVVHNAGGLSCLEGFAMGVPVVGHACLPGHGHRNAEAMRVAGVAALADSTEDLVLELKRLAGTAQGAAMAARALDLFRADPTEELLALAGAPERAPARVPARAWAARAAALTVAVPATMGALSFGVAQATVHANPGVGLAEGDGAVFVAAVVDHALASDPVAVGLLKSGGVTAALRRHDATAPTPTDLAALVSAGVTLVGTEQHDRRLNPGHRRDDLAGTARLVADATHDRQPKVLLLQSPSWTERVVAWDHDVQLALPRVVVRGGSPLPGLTAGEVIVLDERGRTTEQLRTDLEALSQAVRAAHLPEHPLRALWPTAGSAG